MFFILAKLNKHDDSLKVFDKVLFYVEFMFIVKFGYVKMVMKINEEEILYHEK